MTEAEKRQEVGEKNAETDDDLAGLYELMREFAAMPSLESRGNGYTLQELEEAAAESEKIYEPVKETPYDKALAAMREAERARDSAQLGSEAYHAAMSALATAKSRFKVEQERGLSSSCQRYREIDEWRGGTGREEYNAGRRHKRDRPNVMTNKSDLDAMSDEERAQHVRDQKADSAAKQRATKKYGTEGEGLTGEQLRKAVETAVELVRGARRIRRAEGA